MPHAAWRISSREWQQEHPAPASDRREPRALLQRRDRSLPCAQQRRVVCTRSLPLSLLRTALHARRVDARPRDAAVARRPGYLGKRRVRLSGLQPEKRRTLAAAGRHAVAGGAIQTELGGTPDPLQPQHPRRPDGIPGAPFAEGTAPGRVTIRAHFPARMTGSSRKNRAARAWPAAACALCCAAAVLLPCP